VYLEQVPCYRNACEASSEHSEPGRAHTMVEGLGRCECEMKGNWESKLREAAEVRAPARRVQSNRGRYHRIRRSRRRSIGNGDHSSSPPSLEVSVHKQAVSMGGQAPMVMHSSTMATSLHSNWWFRHTRSVHIKLLVAAGCCSKGILN
jgi:hypothetical protein